MNKCRLCVAICALGTAFAIEASAEAGPDWARIMAEAEWDWHPGDLIFRDDLNAMDDLVQAATGAEWASVGILRASSGGPRVVYADEAEGVTEMMLYEFVDGLGPMDYAVYRIGSLDHNGEGQMEQGVMARYALNTAYEVAFDSEMTLGADRYYNAELPYLAALSSGVTLGPLPRIGDVVPASSPLAAALLAGPACDGSSADMCWGVLARQQIVTTDALIGSSDVERVFP